jgi:hypothetical protein
MVFFSTFDLARQAGAFLDTLKTALPAQSLYLLPPLSVPKRAIRTG